MGTVYLCQDTRLDRLVALKVPHFSGPDHFQLRDRFLREARVAATLAHPNLCPVYDCGEVNGVLYLTMAYLEGKPLARFIRPGQQLPARTVAIVVRQLALAMQEAHESGVIHRDLKPSNIMITRKKQAVIMDFGLARRIDADDLRLTQTGLLVGTPAYMPPEQINGDAEAIGPTADVYALGVILYELLAGRQPFQGPLGALMARIMTEPPPPLSRWRNDLDPALDAICARALAKDPADRIPSMQVFAAALEDYLHGRSPVQSPEPEPEPADEDAPLDERDTVAVFRALAARQSRPSRAVGLRRRRRRLRLPEWLIPLTTGGLAVAAVCYGLWSFFRYLDERGRRPESPAGAALDPAWVAEEQLRRRDSRLLREALFRWRARPNDLAARQELDQWLQAPAGRRLDLPPEINLALGQFLILEGNRWEEGLRRLALSSEGPWREAADADLAAAAASTPSPWLAGGDRWWGLAERRPGADELPATDSHRQRLRGRAALWYRKALPLLSEAERPRVERRLAQIGTGA